MTHLIRLIFERPDSKPLVKVVNENSFSGSCPMRHQGKPCRSLLAQALLTGGMDQIAKKAYFLHNAASNDPNEYLFMDGSQGMPFGIAYDHADCADWICRFDGTWMGRSRGDGDLEFESPLFSFWLAQALWVNARSASKKHQAGHGIVDGAKRTMAASANLNWEWQSIARRLELFLAAYRSALNASPECIATELAHPNLVKLYSATPLKAFARLAGSDAELLALLEHEQISSASSCTELPASSRTRL